MTELVNTVNPYEAPQIQLQELETSNSPIVWWIVLVIILLALGLTIAIAVVGWCIIHGGGFVVQWTTLSNGSQVRIGCSK